MDDAQFDAWTRHRANSSRRQIVRVVGGLVGLPLGILAGSRAASAEPLSRCCLARNEENGMIISGCFKNKRAEGGCPTHLLPEGYVFYCSTLVRKCKQCTPTTCTPTAS